MRPTWKWDTGGNDKSKITKKVKTQKQEVKTQQETWKKLTFEIK